MQCILDLFEYRRVLSNTHAKKLLRSPVLVEEVVGILPELFHLCTNEHLAKFGEVALFFVIDFDNTPRILASTNLTAVGCALAASLLMGHWIPALLAALRCSVGWRSGTFTSRVRLARASHAVVRGLPGVGRGPAWLRAERAEDVFERRGEQLVRLITAGLAA